MVSATGRRRTAASSAPPEAGATGEFLHKGLGLADEAVVRHGRELDTGHAAAARLEEPGGAPQTHVVAELTAADR